MLADGDRKSGRESGSNLGNVGLSVIFGINGSVIYSIDTPTFTEKYLVCSPSVYTK